MRSYFYCLKNAYNSITRYRANTVFRIVSSLISLFPAVFLWRALYGGADEAVIAGVNLGQMLTFIVVSRLINISSSSGVASYIENRIKNGDIALDIMRPVEPRLLFIFQNLGGTLASMIFDGLPVFVISILLLGGIMPPASVSHFLLFIISLIGAMIINTLIQTTFGTIAFWFANLWIVRTFIYAFDALFSGRFVPLWFLPGWLVTLSLMLPFQAIRFLPVSIYLGMYLQGGIVFALLTQLFWIFFLFFLQFFIWKKGINRLVVLGG